MRSCSIEWKLGDNCRSLRWQVCIKNENWKLIVINILHYYLFYPSVSPSELLLRLGEYDLAEEEEPYLYQERRVQIVASHPQFDPRTFEYDLALLRFYEPVVFQPNIIPVCVPETDENFIGRTAFVTGWGRLYEGEYFLIEYFNVYS